MQTNNDAAIQRINMQHDCAMRCHGKLIFTIRPRPILLCFVFTNGSATRKIIN